MSTLREQLEAVTLARKRAIMDPVATAICEAIESELISIVRREDALPQVQEIISLSDGQFKSGDLVIGDNNRIPLESWTKLRERIGQSSAHLLVFYDSFVTMWDERNPDMPLVPITDGRWWVAWATQNAKKQKMDAE